MQSVGLRTLAVLLTVRLVFVMVKDESKINKMLLRTLEKYRCSLTQGQYQIVTVSKIYDEVK